MKLQDVLGVIEAEHSDEEMEEEEEDKPEPKVGIVVEVSDS